MARILGKRSFAVFALVTFLIVAILASVNIASRFALKQYVEDQLSRINWDISAYQTGDVAAIPEVTSALENTEGISDHNNLLFLRNSMTTEDIAYIDGQPIRMPWLSLLTTTDISILPLNIRPQEGKAVLVLVGTKSQMGNAYAELQNRKRFELKIENDHTGEEDHHEGEEVADEHTAVSVDVFDLDLERTIRIERKDLNRWFLEQTSSPSLIPEIGTILVIPYDEEIINSFDELARGIVTQHDDGDIHEEAGNYFPDIIHLLKVDTEELISGWDINGSLGKLIELQTLLDSNTFAIGPRVFIDNSTKVLLERMNDTAQKVGLISLLIALPLIWVGWILMGNLSGMLLLNERRKFGLMRLRGVSGKVMGRALQLSIGTGALLGGILGAVIGTLLPIWIYEGGLLPFKTILIIQQPYILLTFIVIGVGVALAVSRKLVKYASTISPLEASGRVVNSESEQGNVSFGITGFIALVLGSYKIISWIMSYSISADSESKWLISLDQALDFAGFPLFVYGLVTFLVSRKTLMNKVLNMIVAVIGGSLRHLTVKHISTRPQRIAGFLLIVAMMTTIGLYPTVMTAVFDNKIERGTQVQVGSDIQLTLNASDIVSNELLASGGVAEQYRALQKEIPQLIETMKNVEGVRNVTWTLFEGVSDGVYMPGYGFNGLPLYFMPDKDAYMEAVYSEESLAQEGGFNDLMNRLPEGQVVMSPAVASFINKAPGETTSLGRNINGADMIKAEVAGALWYLPGSPLVSVTDRESFDTARIDYVNYLFSNNAYLAVDPNIPAIGNLDVLISGVQFAIDLVPGSAPDIVRDNILRSLPVEPSSIRTYDEEIGKIGSDMYIFLARQNVQIYLIGGLLLAIIGILSVAFTNFLEDRRTLGLLRIRGAGPMHMLRFFGSGIFAPSYIGLLLGIIVSLIVGFGITNLVWQLREVKNILLYLTTRIAVSELTVIIGVILFSIITIVGVVFSQWAFRKSVREGLSEG
ncbi:MAG: hypothetical protein ACI9XC_002567 [Gammaproteobacteria bacterium]